MLRVRLTLLLASTAFAQSPLQLSLKQAVDIALAPDASTRVKLAEEAIQQSESRAAQSQAALLPTIDGSISDQNLTRNLKAFAIQFPSLPLPGFTFPPAVGPFHVFDAPATPPQT